MANKTILITGATRGIGRGLAEIYLARDNTTLIAAVRKPTDAAAKSLEQVKKGSGSKLIVVKIDSSDFEDPARAVKELQTSYGIESLDLVIANAGIASVFPKVRDANPKDIQEHHNVNVVGVVVLYQAVRPLLLKGTNPTLVTMSSVVGSIASIPSMPVDNAVYGPTKATLNWYTQKIGLEDEALHVFPIHPGWVQTDMGNFGAQQWGATAEITLEESVTGIVKVIDGATRESTADKLLCWNGTSLPW